MDDLEKVVRLVTDRLIEKLQDTDQSTIAFVGEPTEDISRFFQEKGYNDITDHEVISPDLLVVVNLSLYSLTRLAQLIPQNETEEKILNRLINKQALWIVEEGMSFTHKRAHLPNQMVQVFDKAKQDLQKWGVKYVNQTLFRKGTSMEPTEKKKISTKKELITVTKAQRLQLSAGDTFYVQPNMILTALAKDYLRDRDIVIEMGNDA